MSVFENEKTVFFAGDGYANADPNACGCLQTWWDDEVSATSAADAMAKLLGIDGAPIVDVTVIQYDNASGQFQVTGVQAMGVESGMLANIYYDDNGVITVGIYEITTVATNYFICDGLEFVGAPGDGIVDIVIGGALWVQDALDKTIATDHSVTIYVKDVDTLITSSLDIDTGGGNNTKNTFKKIIGFNTSPGDMNFGGAYYESPSKILQNGSIDNTKTVLINGNNDNVSIFNITIDNIIIENFHCYNTGTANSIVFVGTTQNIVLRNCRFSVGYRAFSNYGTPVNFMLVDSCYSDSTLTDRHYGAYGRQNTFLGCVANLDAGANFVTFLYDTGIVIGCLAAGAGDRGVYVVGGNGAAIIVNNTFYGLVVCGIYASSCENVRAYNNIFSLAPGAVGLGVTGKGSFAYNDYNCFIQTDGTPLTVGSHASGYEVPVIGSHSIEADPLFTDAGNNDFSLKPGSPCRKVGKPTVGAT